MSLRIEHWGNAPRLGKLVSYRNVPGTYAEVESIWHMPGMRNDGRCLSVSKWAHVDDPNFEPQTLSRRLWWKEATPVRLVDDGS